ncbi:hypothetical protein [Tropicimonas sp.]|uniref:hypothetical protein n=1 Tax=Tropicimonas sp. TaxID=2067044 RepID=UPI003A85C022
MRVILAVLVMGTGQAVAECPTRGALAGGATAYVRYPDEGVVGLRWLGEGMVQETTRYPDGEGDFRMISMDGVFIVDEVDLDGEDEIDDSRVTTRFPDDLRQRLPLGPGQDLKVRALNTFANLPEVEEEEIIAVRTGGLAEIDIAGCRYQGFPMLLTYHWGEEGFTSMMTHLPELGVSLEIARMDHGEDPVPFAPLHFAMQPP